MSLEKLVEYTKEEHDALKTKEHCAYYLGSTNSNGTYSNPEKCGNCNGLNYFCIIYQDQLRYKKNETRR